MQPQNTLYTTAYCTSIFALLNDNAKKLATNKAASNALQALVYASNALQALVCVCCNSNWELVTFFESYCN